MNRRNDLLNAWDSRGELPEVQQFSSDSREQVASIFLELAKFNEGKNPQSQLKSSLTEWSGDLASMANSDELSVAAFCAELRSCQLSLVELLLAGYLDKVEDADMAKTLAHTMQAIEQLIESSTRKLKTSDEEKEDSSTDEPKVKVKTLQHEIRTPLQGALLTTELMLEDAQQGDAVQADDIIAVRRSIETAVQILNDFAEKPQ